MASISPQVQQPDTFAYNLAGIPSFLIDPAEAAKRVRTKWFWVGPWVLFSLVSVIAGLYIRPLVQHVMEVAPMPANVSPEQLQKRIQIGQTIQTVFLYLAPLTMAFWFALQSAILLMTTSVMSIGAKFRELFNLVAGCAIIQILASIASLIILKTKGEISTMAELRPALGLDIFLPEGTNRVLTAVVGYFSVFEIWWIVMVVLVLSAAFRVSKGKALAAVLPLVLLNLCWRAGAAALQR